MGIENGHVIAMDRKNNEPEITLYDCSNCHRDIEGLVIKHEEGYFCDEDCLQEHLIDNAEFEEVKI